VSFISVEIMELKLLTIFLDINWTYMAREVNEESVLCLVFYGLGAF